MYTSEALLDMHERGQRNLQKLLAHCRSFRTDELNRSLEGFGYPTLRLQLHHEISAQEYWLGVLHGRVDAEETEHLYPTIESLEAYRTRVADAVTEYLRKASTPELDTARPMKMWGGAEKSLVPAHVFLRTLTHLYHHQGQIVAMCRLLGKPASGMDFPLG